MRIFESFLRKKLLYEPSPVDVMAVWEAVQRKKKRRRRLLLFWWCGGIAASLILAVWGWQRPQNQALSTDGQEHIQPTIASSDTPKTSEANVDSNVENNTEDVEILTQSTPQQTALNQLNEPQNLLSKHINEVKINNDRKEISPIKPPTTIDPSAAILSNNDNNQSSLNVYLDHPVITPELPMKRFAMLNSLPERAIMPLVERKPSLPPLFRYGSRLLQKQQPPKNNLPKYITLMGTGPSLRTSEPNMQWPGTVTPLQCYQFNFSRLFYTRKDWFGELGLQAQHWATRMQISATKQEKIFERELNVPELNTNGLEFRKDTLWLHRTTTRTSTMHHYANFISLYAGAGKTWRNDRITYQLATHIGGSMGWHSGNYIDDDLETRPVSTTAQRRFTAAVQAYGQVNYHLSTEIALSARLNYWQWMNDLDRGARYALPGLQLGISWGGR
jgi:hypothetical protein